MELARASEVTNKDEKEKLKADEEIKSLQQ